MKYITSILIFVNILFFAACENHNTATNSTSNTKNTDEEYLKKGQQIAATTFATLSGNLQKAMQEGGVENAVKFCNLAAVPLVDSLSQIHNANIRRTFLKNRSPKNKPTSLELEQLQTYQKQYQAGENLKPIIKEIDAQTIAFYAPIHMMPLCEKCHRKIGSTLLQKDYDVIHQLYPEDKAIGYVGGDWRGMWSISFKK